MHQKSWERASKLLLLLKTTKPKATELFSAYSDLKETALDELKSDPKKLSFFKELDAELSDFFSKKTSRKERETAQRILMPVFKHIFAEE